MPKVLKIFICILAVALLTGMTFMIYNYRQEAQERSAHIAALSAEAKAYESELNQLKREQELQEMQSYVPDGPGAAVVAFRIGGEETLETALAYSEAYSFTAAILVNVDDENIEYILDAISGGGLDIVFGCGDFTSQTGSELRAALEAVEERGCYSTHSFLLRAGDDSEENRKALSRAGITTLFLYGDTLRSEVSNEFTELNYSYVSRSGYNPASRLAELGGSEQGLLFAVDLVSTTVTDKQLEDILMAIKEADDDGHIVIGSVENAVRVAQKRAEAEQALTDEFLEAQAERGARIAELEETIREIYSHWDD